jgi:pre-mRNA-splicing factor CWC26
MFLVKALGLSESAHRSFPMNLDLIIMSSLSSYLAKNYLTASKSSPSDLSTRPKKRRKKDTSSSNTGLIIADDDEDLTLSNQLNGENEDNTPALDTNLRSAEFRRTKKNNWKTIGAPAPTDADQAAADRILADAAKESDVRRGQVEGEDAPAIAGETADTEPQWESQKVRGGLQTAEETARIEAVVQARRAREAKTSKTFRRAEAEETVYRDATGRRIDISMKRAEARAAEQEKLRQERKEKEEAMGDVQRREKEEKKQAVEEAKLLSVARYADDEGLNEETKEIGRWGDPMLAYVNERKREATGKEYRAETTSTAGRAKGRKEYQGAAAPNRYGIRPGWRWDGVDRGNGFEKEWFQARGKKSRNENTEYQWQMDE